MNNIQDNNTELVEFFVDLIDDDIERKILKKLFLGEMDENLLDDLLSEMEKQSND